MMQLLVQFGTGSLLQVFIQKYAKGDERRRVLLTFCMLIPLVVIALLCIPFFLFKMQAINSSNPADRLNLLTFYDLIPITIFLWSYMTLFDFFLASQSKNALSAFVRDVVLRICNIILILLFFFKSISFYSFVTGLLLMYGIPAFILFLLTLRTEKRLFSTNWRVFGRDDYRSMFHFTWYHLLILTSYYLLGNVDIIMLGAMDKSGMASIAVYKIAFYALSLMLIPSIAMASATFPILNKAYLNNDHAELKSLFNRSAINTLLVTLGTAALLFCNLPNMLTFIAKGYDQIIPLFSILILGRIVDVATGLNNEVISISKYYKFSFRVCLLLVALVFVFDYFLVPRYSIYGAAWGTSLALVIYNLLKYLFLWKKMHLQPFDKNTFLLFISVAPAVAAGYFMPYLINVYVDGIVRSLVIVGIYAGMLVWLKPSPDLNLYLASVKQHKKLF